MTATKHFQKIAFTTSVIPVILSVLSLTILSLTAIAHATASNATINPWWPVNNANISGVQPFKGAVDGWNVSDYTMGWSVDNGPLTLMPTSYADYPHKEATVDVQNWNWQSTGKYTITYIAQNNSGQEIARTSFVINLPRSTAFQTATITKNLQGQSLFVNPYSNAAQQASAWRQSRPDDAAKINKLAAQPQAKWFGDWNSDVQSDVASYVASAAATSSTPVLVAYNIPQRDCGGYSGGGTAASSYASWVQSFAKGIGTKRAIVILEPDALANMDCLSSSDQATRTALLKQAVSTLKANAKTYVYIDGGHPGWHTPADMAGRLKSAGIADADGFSLNVSNFITTADNTSYGQAISSLINNKHFVIDTSRNGNGPTADYQWCNPSGRAVGANPTTDVANPVIDAYLWIKTPGESDGSCNGGLPAGSWWGDYALGLVKN